MSVSIVLIEPNSPDRYWVQLMLNESRIEHRLQMFPSAIFALEDLSASSDAVDFVIINVVLPILDIHEAVEKLRTVQALQSATFVVMILDDDDRRWVPEGCRVLVKPPSAEALAACLT